MSHPKSLAFTLIGLALAAPASAFVPPSHAASRSQSSLRATRDANNGRAAPANVIRSAAAASALCLGLLFPATDALAATGTAAPLPSNDHAVSSSTVALSIEIKTMDFSMPSSYDNLSAPVASGTDELTTSSYAAVPKVATNLSAGGMTATTSAPSSSNAGAAKQKKSAKKAEKAEKKSAPAPSGLSRKEGAAAKKAARVAAREADAADQDAREADAAKERDENIKAARLEKIAAREAARAEEANAAREKEGGKFSGAKTMDTSMPSF